MSDIPTKEPSHIQAGDTLRWLISLADYPASQSWVLAYRLINSATHYDITSAASGDVHLVTASASVTATYAPGEYKLIGFISKGSERYTVHQSNNLVVLPDLSAAVSGYDTRSTAKKVLDMLDAAMLAHGSSAWVQEYEINGRSMKFRNVSEFLLYRSKIIQEVAREKNAARLRAGLSLKNKISVRF